MSNIYVYPSGYVNGVLLDDSETDFSTAGLVGALTPTSCIFREVRNNERSIEIEHPLDAEGRYKALVKGYILSVKVPVMTVPATGDSPIDITWHGSREDYPDNPTQGYAFYLHSEDEEDDDPININYYYSASIANAWRNSSTNVFTMGIRPVVGDTAYTLDSQNNVKVRGIVSVVNTSDDSVTSIKIKPNTGSDSRTYSRSSSYDRELSGIWCRFGTDGSPIVWKGELSSEPSNPQTNWAYKDTSDGFTYYYLNSEWVRLCDSSKMDYVWKYRIKSSYADKKKYRTVYKKKKNGGKLVVLETGAEVYVIEKDEKEDKRWKVRTPKHGEGYMLPDALELIQGGTYDIRENWKIIQDVASPWIVTTQLFRIYKVSKNISSIKVTARDVSYDCLNNIFSSSYKGSITLDQLLKNMKTDTFGALTEQQPVTEGDAYTRSGYEQINFLTPDGYLIDNITENEYKGKTLTDVMVNEENGICAKFNVIRVVDNYNIYFIRDPGINRGFAIQYGKNMLGVDYEINDDEIVTAIIPVGKNKKGDPLYLGPQKSKEAKKNYIGWYGNIIWSINKDKYPTKRYYVLECDVQAKSDKKAEIDYAMDQMRYMAESKIHAANKQTNAPDGDMDEPKITATVEFLNLGDTEEYKQFKNLEKCFLHDYVTIRHPDLGIDITARVTEMEWDCLLDRMNKITLGNVKENEGRAAQYAAHQAERAASLAERIGSEAYDQAAEKRRVFSGIPPIPPYDEGDLWITDSKDLMVCVREKYSDEEYSSLDWELATKYTDTGLEWKGTFTSVEDLIEEFGNPEDGWAYKNSTTKKSYYYQNGSWHVITEDGEPGAHGVSVVTINLFKRSSSTPATVSGPLTYTFSTGELTPSSNLNGWSTEVPGSNGQSCYMIQKTIISTEDSASIAVLDWSSPIIAFDDGADGDDGVGISGVVNYYLASPLSSGVTWSTQGWTTTVQQTTLSNKYLWNYEETTFSDGSTDRTSPCIIGNYAADGTAGRGVESIIEYYNVSEGNTSAYMPTTWYTTPQQMTSEYPYLWNYEVVRYTAGDPEETAKRVIGAYGRSVIGTTQYYYLASSPPPVPTMSDPTYIGWTTSQPTYVPGSTDKIYTVIKTVYSTLDSSTGLNFSYSPVSELYANAKVDTFIEVDNAGNTHFKNSANNASVMLDSVEPSVNLMLGNTNVAKFKRNGIDFSTENATFTVPAISIREYSVDEGYKPIVGIGKVPSVMYEKSDIEVGNAVVDNIFCPRSYEACNYTSHMYYTGINKFTLYYQTSSDNTFVLTTQEPDNWASEWMYYFKKTSSSSRPYTPAGGVYDSSEGFSAPVWQANTYYRCYFGGNSESEVYAWAIDSEITIKDNGQFVELSGVITPYSSSISGSADLIKIMDIPQIYCPDKEINVLCQGTNQNIWMLIVTTNCEVFFTRHRSGSSWSSCAVGNWLPFHVMWMKSWPTWIE